ncbi:MAG: IS607 family transposase [Candidatus Hermodarchaeota archaeon]
MKLSQWAQEIGITYHAAWKMYKAGKIPYKTEQLPTGTIIVYPRTKKKTQKAVLYARVSSREQKNDLERQLNRLRDFAAANNYPIIQEIKEIGSALNGRRKKLLDILKTPQMTLIISEHKDRLTRFGYEYLDTALRATGRQILILNEGECKDDLVQDMLDVLTSFCGRLYGRRSARLRARRAMKAVEKC